MNNKNKEIIAWCSYCKNPIYKGEKHVINEDNDYLHKDCDDLVSNDFGFGSY